MKNACRSLSMFSLISIFMLVLSACSNNVYHSQSSYLSTHTNNVAIRGYDPVAYFKSHTSALGNHQYTYTYAGRTWQFKNPTNRMVFMKNPHYYMPQYNGYSAYDVAQGSFRRADPRIWKIVNGKLYLNRDADIQKQWQRNPNTYIKQANDYWRQYLGIQHSNTRVSALYL